MITSYTDGFSAIGDFQKDIINLPRLNDYEYHNFFKLYLTEDSQYYYNLFSFCVYILNELDPSSYYEITVDRSIPWTSVSYNEYRNIDLWWLIMVVNKIYNPMEFPKPGDKLKILFPQFARHVLTKLKDNV